MQPPRPIALFQTLSGARHRVGQFMAAARTASDPLVDARLQALLGSEQQWRLLQRLTPFDRAHHLDVHERALAAGCRDADVLRAALLHDVGKADVRGRVWLGHRVAYVLLRRFAPTVLVRCCASDRWRILHGLYLAVHHAEFGATLAEAAGASTRCAWLIAHHEDSVAAANDPDLLILLRADAAATR